MIPFVFFWRFFGKEKRKRGRGRGSRGRKTAYLGDREKNKREKLYLCPPPLTVQAEFPHLGPEIHRGRILLVDLLCERGDLAGREVAQHRAEVLEVAALLRRRGLDVVMLGHRRFLCFGACRERAAEDAEILLRIDADDVGDDAGTCSSPGLGEERAQEHDFLKDARVSFSSSRNRFRWLYDESSKASLALFSLHRFFALFFRESDARGRGSATLSPSLSDCVRLCASVRPRRVPLK